MKEVQEKRIVETVVTTYISDDNLVKDDNKSVVESYEQSLASHHGVKLYETTEYGDTYTGNGWQIYRCATEDEFKEALSSIYKSHHISKQDIRKAYEHYTDNNTLYAFLVEEAQGDYSWDELTTMRLSGLTYDYERYIEAIKEEARCFEAELNKLRSLEESAK